MKEDATCALYGGGATAVVLLLTSIHALRAGVRLAVAEILLQAGACLDSLAAWPDYRKPPPSDESMM